MKKLLVLGGGTAGTMIVNKLRRRLPVSEWEITVVDRDDEHHYQPGYLFLPFGTYSPDQVVRSRHALHPRRRRPRDRRGRPRRRRGEHRCASQDGRTLRLRLPRDRHRHDAPARPDAGDARASSGAGASSTSTPSRAPRPWPRRCRSSTTAGSSSTSPRCRSSARSPRWSSPSSPTPGCASAASATASSSSTSRRCSGAFTQPVASAAPRRHARRAQDPRRARLHGRADRQRPARRWSPTTSARSPSTCW